MISIDAVKCSDGDEDCILMALYHYQLTCLGDKSMKKVLMQVNKVIDKITESYPSEGTTNSNSNITH